MPSNKNLNSAKVYRKLIELAKPSEDATYFYNRNPRNLEMLKIAYKPDGYHLEQPGRKFWHKLVLEKERNFVTAQLQHYKNGVVLQASTKEWSLRKQLYKSNDSSAYINLGKVFAQRCLEAGLIEMQCDIEIVPNGKVEKFLNEVQSNGISLTESERYIKKYAYDSIRMQKPWEIHLD